MIKIEWEENQSSKRRVKIGSVGGEPNISINGAYPFCKRCSSQLAYYFTLDINSILSNRFLSIFYCIKCTGSETPELPSKLNDQVSLDECRHLQQEYRIYIHKNEIWTGEIFSPLVKRDIYGVPSKLKFWQASHIAGEPSDRMLIEASCGRFILQIREFYGLRFETRPGAPPQQAYLLDDNDEEFPERGYYKLFNEIPVYFYLTEDEECCFVITGRF